MKTVAANIKKYKVIDAQLFFEAGDPHVKAYVPSKGCVRIDERPISINVLKRERSKAS